MDTYSVTSVCIGMMPDVVNVNVWVAVGRGGTAPMYQPLAQGIGSMGDARVTSTGEEISKRFNARESDVRTKSTVVRRETCAAGVDGLARMKTGW